MRNKTKESWTHVYLTATNRIAPKNKNTKTKQKEEKRDLELRALGTAERGLLRLGVGLGMA